MPKPDFELRTTAGLSFAGVCRWFFWLGWLGLTLGLWAVLYAQYRLVPYLPPVFYFLLLIPSYLGPFLTLAFADLRSVSIYYATYSALSHRSQALVVLDPLALDRGQAELKLNALLSWTRPSRRRNIRAQLVLVSVWWPAVIAPQGSPWLRRYGEWLATAGLGYIPLALGLGLAIALLLTASQPDPLPLVLALNLFGLGLMVTGYAAIRLAARRQAIFDYFKTWLVPRAASPADAVADLPPG